MAVGTQSWRLPSVGDVLEEGSEQYYSEDFGWDNEQISDMTLYIV